MMPIFGSRIPDSGVTFTDHKISPFKVLYLKDCKYVYLRSSDSSFVHYRKSTAPSINDYYAVAGDTLKVTNYPGAITINTTASISKVCLNSTSLTLIDFASKQLSIEMDQSRLNSEKRNNGFAYIQLFTISAKNQSSVFLEENYTVDSLKISMQNSNAILKGAVQMTNGTLTDNSTLSSMHPGSHSIATDINSKMHISW